MLKRRKQLHYYARVGYTLHVFRSPQARDGFVILEREERLTEEGPVGAVPECDARIERDWNQHRVHSTPWGEELYELIEEGLTYKEAIAVYNQRCAERYEKEKKPCVT